ncbi:MAG: hypothetical protein R3Y05_03765 [bacterium]
MITFIKIILLPIELLIYFVNCLIGKGIGGRGRRYNHRRRK